MMDEIITEKSGSVLRVELNRPAKKNAMTGSMYVALSAQRRPPDFSGTSRSARVA
jgi:enoyl-CoA hydratase/carnithine racemase